MGADDLIDIPVAAAALEAEGDLIRRALHGLHDLHGVGVVAHEDEVFAPVLLEDGQHVGQLPGLQRHENEVVAVVRGQRVDGGHPIHRGAALRPVADDEAPLVEPLLPLAPRQHGDDILFVLQQTVGQLTARLHHRPVSSSLPASLYRPLSGAGSHQCFKNEKNPFFSYGFSSAPVTV